MIRIHFTAQDIAAVRVAEVPDVGAELVLGAGLLARRHYDARLAHWHATVERRRHPRTSRLFDLCIPTAVPGFFCHVVADDRRATAEATAGLAPEGALPHLRLVAGSRPLSPFARALAEGEPDAFTQLGAAVGDFQAAGLDPYRPQIESSVAADAARMAGRMARLGIRGLLQSLHPTIRWDGSTLSIEARSDSDRELEDRTLLVRPTVFATGPALSVDVPGYLVLHIPTRSPLYASATTPPRHRALAALLGSSRAAVLTAIIEGPGLSTSQLAVATRLSDAAASRHATALREAGLVRTQRVGMAVRHSATRLGLALTAGDGGHNE